MEDIVWKDDTISMFDKFDALGFKWILILIELLVDDVAYKFFEIAFAQFNTDPNKSFMFGQVRSIHHMNPFY